MTTVNDIHEEIERVSEHRAELRQRLSQQHDPALVAEIKVVDGELETLWDDLRALRARLRFGDRDKIVSRARIEERLERAA
jgi:hypothetical protein